MWRIRISTLNEHLRIGSHVRQWSRRLESSRLENLKLMPVGQLPPGHAFSERFYTDKTEQNVSGLSAVSRFYLLWWRYRNERL
jgi:hypothetical protein